MYIHTDGEEDGAKRAGGRLTRRDELDSLNEKGRGEDRSVEA